MAKPPSVAVVEFTLLDPKPLAHKCSTATLFELLDDLALSTCDQQFLARLVQLDTPLRHHANLRNDRAVEILDMRIVQAQLFDTVAFVLGTQQRGTFTEFSIETIELALCLIVSNLPNRNDLLLLVFDTAAVLEQRLQRKSKASGHYATLMSEVTACS